MINGYKVRDIPTFSDNRGSLSFAEYDQLLDFQVNRVYWLYNLTKERGAHAHKKLKQFIFCAHGSVDIVLSNGNKSEIVVLSDPSIGLIIDKPLWREITNLKNNPSVIVLASDKYDEDDYITSYKEFQAWQSLT